MTTTTLHEANLGSNQENPEIQRERAEFYDLPVLIPYVYGNAETAVNIG